MGITLFGRFNIVSHPHEILPDGKTRYKRGLAGRDFYAKKRVRAITRYVTIACAPKYNFTAQNKITPNYRQTRGGKPAEHHRRRLNVGLFVKLFEHGRTFRIV